MALSKEEAKRLSIISVAEQLGMELKRTGSYSYTWTEHDSFVIDTRKNEFHWNSRTEFGDVIQLVQTIRGVSYKEAMHFLETGEFKAVDVEAQTASKEPFSYHLERYERQNFSASRRYLKAQRGLSDDTINFFISQSSIAEAIRKKGDYFEPVIVFKYKDNTGFLAGASLQGIVENRVHYPERGRLKQIMRNSDGQLGFSIDIGNPKRLVFSEAPIDLMSYYELHKDRLQDVRLVAMDGIKDGIISRRFMELYAEMNGRSYQVDQNAGKALETVARTTNYFKDGQNQDMITLAVDNDAAGHNFITRLQEKGIPVQIAIPPIVQENQEKEDWNDFLKRGNEVYKDLAHVYIADEKSWHYQGFFEKEIALAKAQELTADDVKAFVSDRQLTREEVRQEYQAIINKERGRENTMSELYGNSSDHEDDLVNSHKQADGVLIQPETQAIIDSGEVKQWAKYPNIYFVKGLRFVALELTEEGKFEQSSQYLPKTEEEKEVVNKLLSKHKDQGELVLEDDQSSELNIDTSNLSPEDAEWLKKNWHNISFSVETKKQMVIDGDKTVIFKKPSAPGGDTYEAPEENQSTEKAPESSQEQMNDRTSGGTGSLQPKAEGSTSPVLETSTFEQTVTSHPTSSYPYLQFSTNYDKVQRRIANYHPITPADLRRLNQYAPSIQSTASWYLNELADSKISFVYADHGEENVLQVTFQKDNFIHLSGIRPFEEGKGAANFLDDIANGQGHYDGMLISNAIKDKLQVLPMLRDILDPHSFVLDDLSSVEKLHNLNMSEAIKAKDEDFLLLFKDIGDEKIPASLMKLKGELATNVKSLDEKIILGVYRDRDGHIEQLSINEEYVKDNGAEMLSVLKNKQFEEVSKEIEQTTLENTLNSPLLDSATFTQVLDTVYNLGVPGDISKTPKEFHQTWNQYLDYAKQHNDKFDQIVAAAGEDNLLDTNSDFYKEWKQDHIYKENYHVRLQWAEERPDGPKLPFKETELIPYQDFARELYKANQSFYQLYQEGLKQVTGGHPEAYISPTKIQFSIYAPDGELIQDSIRYNIGEEINPIAHKERLGTREMREYPELMKIDGAIFTPYHLERLASELDISQFSYALEDTLYADQLLSQLPFGDLENSPIGFTDSSHDARLGFISFDGMDSVEVENLSAWFDKLGVKDSPMDQVALVEKWQKEIKSLSEKVEQTIAIVREEFERSQEEEIKLEEQGYNKQELERDADADGVSDEEELLQGTNPYDFRSKPGSKPEGEESLQADEVVLAAGSLAVSDFIQNKDMAGLSRHLKEGIKEFLDSDKYKDYLTKMSQLNNYSNRNLRLILAQNPEAKQVASFKQWKENFGRHVKKGEKALRIFKPMTKIKKDENNQPILDKNGKPETVTFFGLVPVFDVSQTEGKEMPKAAEVKEQLTDLDYANLYRALMAIAKENDVSVRFEEMENNKHGYYSVPENQIVLRSNEMNKAQIIKTFLHEMAHAELHHADNPQKENLTRSTAELQAESVAYVVSSYYGIDTSEYSFNYLSGWSADKETLADLEAQLDIVQQEAKSLMVRMDQALEQLRLSQEKQTKRSFEQKLEKFKGQTQQAVEEHKQELKADAQSKKEKGFSK